MPSATRFLQLLVAALLFACSASSGPTKPNVVLVVLDTHRADILSSYGNSVPTTPHFDALAHQGVRFESAFTTDFWTLPAHASLFTGQYPSRHGATSETNVLSSQAETLAEVLRGAGYRTAAFVSNPWVSAERGFDQGFETFEETWKPRPGVRFEDEGGIQLSREWLAARVERGEPFLAFLNLNYAHMPYTPDPLALHRLHPGPRSVARRSHLRTIPSMWLYLAGAEPLAEPDFEILRELYEAEVAVTDGRLGELIANLRELGILDETLVVVTSDHGENLGDHRRIDHMLSFYDTTIRVPLIFRYPPRIPAGQVNDELVSLIDVAATILDVCGLPADALSGSGRSLLDADRAPRQFVVAENDRPVNGIQLLKGAFPDFDTTPIDSRVRMLRTARYKLVWRTVGPSEFYDLEADPGELHDLGAAPSEAQAALERMLEEWQRRNEGDPASTRFESEDAASLERLRALGYLE